MLSSIVAAFSDFFKPKTTNTDEASSTSNLCHCDSFHVKSLYYKEVEDNTSSSGKCEWSITSRYGGPTIKTDIDTISCKIWIADSVHIWPGDDLHKNIAASIIPKIYRCDAALLVLHCQILTFDAFLLLGSNAKRFLLPECKVTENDGDAEVMFEKIIEKLPKIQYLSWNFRRDCKCFSSDTVKELLKIRHFANVTFLVLDNLPEIFDATAFFAYIKKNKNMKVSLEYDTTEYSAQFKQDIDKIIDEIISTKIFTYQPPIIRYSGLDQIKYKKMLQIYHRL